MEAQTYSAERMQPSRWEIFLHVGKTFKLFGGLMTDRRVALWRKLFFIGSIGGLLALLFFPDLFNEALLSAAFPVIGTLAGVPIDASFDWVTFVLVALSLFRFFPAALVAEHYSRVFRLEGR